MIPAGATNPVALQALVNYLRKELWDAQASRADLERQWILFNKSYRAQPDSPTKDFPFEGASNLVIGIIPTDIDTVVSRILGMLFTPPNMWSCRPLNDQWVDFAPRLEEFLQWAQDAELNVYDAVADWCLELTKLGTGILKQRYRREMKKVYQFRETDSGTIEQQLRLLLKDSPRLDHVSLYDFYVPATAIDIQSAPWCAERIRLTTAQLNQRVAAGLYMMPQRMGPSAVNDAVSPVLDAKERADRFVPSVRDEYELYEFWLDYDLQGGNDPQAIVVTMHIPSNSILRIDYNPFFNQEKPYSFARYLRQEKRFYGIGMCEMLYQYQQEITTMHNQRIDSATLANSTMFKARKGIGIKENEPVIPGRWFLVSNMDDIQPMAMGTRFDSTVPYEEMTLSYAKARDGVNDYIQGKSTAAIGYGAAYTTQAMLQEGIKRFDQVMRETRRCLAESGMRIVELYQQYNQRGKEYLVMGQKEGAMVHQVLQFPMELIRMGVAIEVTATSASLNKEAAIRTNTMLSQMVMQYYMQLMQAASYIANPQVPPMIKQLAADMIVGGSVFIRRIMDDHGLQDSEKMIPSLVEEIERGKQQLSTLQGSFVGGAGGAQGALPPGGVPAPMVGAPGAFAGQPASPNGF